MPESARLVKMQMSRVHPIYQNFVRSKLRNIT